MKMNLHAITYLMLVLAAPLGCAPDAAPSSQARAMMSVGPAAVRPADALVTERARIAASGRYTVASRAPLGLVAATPWSDSLDLPGDAVVATTVTGPPEAAAISNGLGVIRPVRGDSFVLLSTGLAGAPTGPEPGTDFAPTGTAGDAVTLTLDLLPPPGANRLSLQYNFLSSESPEFVGRQFNDTFSIQLVQGGVTRDFTLASVNSSQFFDVSNSRARNSRFDIYTDFPGGIDTVFGATGLPDAGLTGFQSFNIDVADNAPLRVVFTILDNGDGILDSAILVDAVQFSAVEALDPNPDLVSTGGRVTSDAANLAVGGRPVRGLVADGVTELLLRFKVPASGNVTFSILGVNAGADGGLGAIGSDLRQASVTTPTMAVAGGEYAFALLRAPADFNRGGDEEIIERAIQLSATYAPTVGAGFATQVDLQLRRPPLVLAPGLWSKAVDWKLALTDLPVFAITYADHAYSCDEELRVMEPPDHNLRCSWTRAGPGEGVSLCRTRGRNGIDQAAKEALANVRRLGIAASQVDVVAHGAGGLHAREYIESPTYRNPANLEQGDVNRLITINTPHFGSTVADAMVAARNNPANPAGDDFLCPARLAALAPVEPGDIDELTTAASDLAPTPVPAHALIGTSGQTQSEQTAKLKTFSVTILYTRVDTKQFPRRPGVPPSRIFTRPSAVFGDLDHDLFVDVVSQRGGLSGDAVSEVPMRAEQPPTGENPEDGWFDSDFFHSLRHPDVSLRLGELLNSPVEGPRFGEFAGSPSARSGPLASLAAPEEAPAPSLIPDNASLRIVSPADGAEVIAGGTITVEVVAENFIPQSVVALTSKTVATSDTPPFTTTLRIPRDALGPIRLVAMAFDEEGEAVISPDIVMVARTNAIIQAVEFLTQDPILFGIGTRRQLAVVGQYSDGVVRDITASTAGTLYRSSNEGIVAVSSEGVLIAVRSGVATVVAQNGGVQDSTTVTVRGNTTPLAVARGDVALTCVPPGALASVDLDGSESFDPDGDALDFAWFEGEVQVASGPTPTVGLAAGLHTIELQVSDGLGGVANDTVTVSITEDDEPPLLTLVGENPATVECRQPYVDPGATAFDTCDGDLTTAVTSRSSVDANTPGTYLVDYRVQDRASFTSTATRTVTVSDRAAPEVSLGPMRQLFPPLFIYRTFALSDCASAVDRCSGPVDIDATGEILALHSDEPDVAFPLDPANDMVILGPTSFRLRQQQLLPGNGRVYEVEFTVRDHLGNHTPPQSCFVGVKTLQQSPTPINNGRTFTVRP